MRVELYQDRKGEFRFRVKAENGEVVATGEGYKRKASALERVDQLFPGVEIEDNAG